MNCLVVNPGTPQAWEIQLKPGANFIGRNDSNDFTINDPSVSGSHCQILVNDGSVRLLDSGSTNGTFVGGARIQEVQLEDGKNIRLGNVEMIYSSSAPSPAPVANPAPSALSIRIAARTAPPPPPVPEPVSLASSDSAEIGVGTPVATTTGTRFCKFHPKLQAQFLCGKCNRTYCDMCVHTGGTPGNPGPTCRACGLPVVPFQFWQPPSKSFYAKLPAAFVYPFKGTGIVILISATIAFAALNFISGGLFGLFVRGALYGFVFLFMQNIILTTTSDEKECLSFPEVSGLYTAAWQLLGTVLASFWLAIALTVMRLTGTEIPWEFIMGSVILGGIYFPMALLVVAMKESVMAANPLIVIPAMLKEPAKYSVTVVLLLGVFGIRQLGSLISGGAGTMALRTTSQNTFLAAVAFQAMWALMSVYLLTVTMRILGLFYNSSKQKLGWYH